MPVTVSIYVPDYIPGGGKIVTAHYASEELAKRCHGNAVYVDSYEVQHDLFKRTFIVGEA